MKQTLTLPSPEIVIMLAEHFGQVVQMHHDILGLLKVLVATGTDASRVTLIASHLASDASKIAEHIQLLLSGILLLDLVDETWPTYDSSVNDHQSGGDDDTSS